MSTITGTIGADTLTGTSGADQIDGAGGNDRIIGLGGNDTLTGGTGSDVFAYTGRGFGNDTITDFSASDHDQIDLSALDVPDFASLQPFISQSGNNTLISLGDGFGGAESITILNRLPSSLSASDFVFDTSATALNLTGADGGAVVFGASGNDTITGGNGSDVLVGGPGNDKLIGGPGADTLIGGTGNDVFAYTNRGFGNDTINDFTTGDKIDLSALNVPDLDSLQPFISQSGNNTLISLGDGFGGAESITILNRLPSSLSASDFVFDTSATALNLTGADGGAVVFGASGNDTINGGNGSDVLVGGPGNDKLIGGPGADTLIGGTGNDVFAFTSRGFGNDTISDFSTGDKIDISALNVPDLVSLQPFISQSGNNTLISLGDGFGGAESITILNRLPSSLSSSDFIFNTSVSPLNITGADGGAVVFGGSGDDIITGGNGKDFLVGGPGNDKLIGGPGADTLIGGTGNDVFAFTNRGFGNDTINDLTTGDKIDLSALNVPDLTSLQPFISQSGNNTLISLGDGFGGAESITILNRLPSSLSSRDFIFNTSASPLNITGADGGAVVFGGSGNDTITGGNGSDVLVGGPGNDKLIASGGHDTFIGGTGNDTFFGTKAQLSGDTIYDLAIGDRIEFSDAAFGTFTYTVSGSTLSYAGGSINIGSGPYHFTAVAGASGTDLVVSAPTSAADFNGDGHSDLLWRNSSGALSSWQVSGNPGNQVVQGVYNASVDPSWHAVETADFNGDGYSDILWRNTGGAFTIWGGGSGGTLHQGVYTDNSVSNAWQIAGTGDVNGDGKADILFATQDGSISLWDSNGNAFNENAYFHASVGASWKVEGLADFNGDGKADILWRNDSGALSIWTSNGTGFTEGTYNDASVSAASGWHVAGLGDFNGDGKADILWANTNGTVVTWLSNGTGFNETAFAGSVPAGWHVASIGDFNGDGKADIVLRNDGGAVSTWESNGTGFNEGVYNSTVPTSWSIVSHNFPL